MGDPDFGFQSGKKPKADDSEDIAKNQYQRSVDLNELNLGPLKYAKEEIEEIALVIGKGKSGLFTGKDATEERLLNSKAPRILHLATHGFFLQDQDISKDFKNTNRGWDMKPGSSGETSSADRINRQISIESPLLRSGILLAGAVSSIRSGGVQKEDGIVTAEKILGLNLHGTEMVVLSACDTGLGEVKAGEGVFGLRRAFSQAGAKSVVMSMWKVPDSETKEMMIQFYKNIYGSKMNRCQALREAALNQIRIVKGRYGYANPLYWGGFVFVGES